MERLRLEIHGAVQGVGFRPFVYRLARELQLAGWVINDGRGVFIEVEGAVEALRSFLDRLPTDKPPRAVLHSVDSEWLEPCGLGEFTIRHSDESGEKSAVMLPDVATCDDCLRELRDPRDRRFGYPFTNCTNCGPRFTIIRELPYDRPNTTMRGFAMCGECSREYEQPLDRRFHAQPNACPVCGPQLELWDRRGTVLATGEQALIRAIGSLRRGDILAVKGLGGFHLMVDCRDAGAVARLRRRKGRYEKPLALMARDLRQARTICEIEPRAAALLGSPESPIVLLPRRSRANVAEEVAPGNPRLGVMLAYTPLHHLLLDELDSPVVATSGNLSDEPICIDNREALERLDRVADLFLVHDRPIQRHVDDSVVHFVDGEIQPLRRARGLAPMPLLLAEEGPILLAVGGHLKNVVGLGIGGKAFLSQHIGDMETPQAFAAFEAVIRDFLEVYEATPAALAHDLHPDYPTTRWARESVHSDSRTAFPAEDEWRGRLAGGMAIGVQHHHAHLASCLAEHGIAGRALGVTWDGTGYGTDATIWGGEFLLGDAAAFQRVARLRPFSLPGGDAAVREPRRVALAVLWEMWGEAALEREDLAPIRALAAAERRVLGSMLAGGLRSPSTTSAGRLFDAVAALLDLRQTVSFEGQAAMALEFIACAAEDRAYPIEVGNTTTADGELLELDWRPLVEAVLEDSRRGVDAGIIAARFHNALVEALVAVAQAIAEPRVALTGGCFQNLMLTERAARRLREAGFEVWLHRQVPANDGGLCLGQLAVAAARLGVDRDPS